MNGISIQVRVLGVLVLGTVCAFIACGGGGGGGGASALAPAAQEQMLLSLASQEVNALDVVAVSVAMPGAANTAVAWTVDGIPGGNGSVGTLSGSGSEAIYTAPAVPGSHTLAATSLADATMTAASSVQVVLPAMTVTVNPGAATVAPGGTLPLAATVAGSAHTAVVWTVDGVVNGSAAVGTLSGSGDAVTYTAPAQGDHTVTATSAVNAQVSGWAAVSVQAPAPVTPPVQVTETPASAVINVSGSMLFTAAVAGSGNTGLTWTVDGIANGNAAVGTITASAAPTSTGITVIYTAPAVAGSHTVTAVSVANPADSASAVVTVASATVQVANPALVVNVKDAPYNAAGNGVADDTAAIQQAIDTVAGTGGQVLIPAGTYLINPVVNNNAGIRLGGNMTLTMAAGAVLQALPTSTSNYVVLLASGVANVNISGGTVIGNRNDNTITDTNEEGFGVEVANSQHVVVEGVTVTDCWADGFYIASNAQDVTLCADVADDSRRNGLSIVDAAGVVVRGCTFENATGCLENGVMTNGSGIDIEPNPGQTVSTVLISRSTFSGNNCLGLSSGVPEASTGSAFVNTIFIDGNTFTANRIRGINISNCSGTVVTSNTCTGNGEYGILLTAGADNAVCTGNRVSGTTGSPGNGIDVDTCTGDTVTGNTSTGNAGHGVYVVASTGCTVSGNTQSGDGIAP